MQLEWHRDGYTIGTDPAWLDLGVIHGFLAASYWATGIPREVVRRSIEHSINFGIYHVPAAAGRGTTSDAGSGGSSVPRPAGRPGDATGNAPTSRAGRPGDQVGFARVITDRATFGYLGDVFVLEPHRGRGLSRWLLECIDRHPELKDFRRWVLLTRDAHGLYRKFGYAPVQAPERYMERWAPDVYAPDSARLGEGPGSRP